MQAGLKLAEITAGPLYRARTKYGAATLLAVQEQNAAAARDVYELAQRLPSTATIDELSVFGYKLNGLLFESSELVVCYKGERVHVLKCLDSKEAARLARFHEVFGGSLVPGVTPYELVTTHSGKRLMFMPKYATALEPVPYLSEGGIEKLWANMQAALSALHSQGFAHMDIKPANICLDGAGEAFLIDLGSVCAFGAHTSSTPAYVPHDVLSRRSSAALDWWMLAMTLAEKACGPEGGLPVGYTPCSATMSELRAHLARFLPDQMWADLQTKLVPV